MPEKPVSSFNPCDNSECEVNFFLILEKHEKIRIKNNGPSKFVSLLDHQKDLLVYEMR